MVILATSCGNGAEQPGSSQRTSDAVDVLVIQGEEIENTIFLTGTLMANEEIEIRAEVAGRIEKLAFNEGSKVAQGALLIKIDDAEWQAQLLKAKSLVQLAEKDKSRKRQLLEAKGISQEEFDQAETRLNELKAEVAVIESKIRNANIYAPFSGTIGLRYTSLGAYVNQGQMITQLVQNDPMKIEFAVPQRYAAFMEKGMKITFKMDGSAEELQAEIYAYDSRIDPGSRTLKVRAKAPNKEGKLIPGAFVEVKLVLQNIPDALMIPTAALVPQIRGQKVFVLEDGLAQSREVEVGIRTETEIQITKGLSAGDTLVTSALLAIKDGAPLQVRNVKNSTK